YAGGGQREGDPADAEPGHQREASLGPERALPALLLDARGKAADLAGAAGRLEPAAGHLGEGGGRGPGVGAPAGEVGLRSGRWRSRSRTEALPGAGRERR